MLAWYSGNHAPLTAEVVLLSSTYEKEKKKKKKTKIMHSKCQYFGMGFSEFKLKIQNELKCNLVSFCKFLMVRIHAQL